ncbi:MAG: Flp pilus assembly complex ATPase component TadA [Desulfosarcina sp.]|nr:Flp pilus assembly complex ATPase component TadA [Desulfobacterales bacterium]
MEVTSKSIPPDSGPSHSDSNPAVSGPKYSEIVDMLIQADCLKEKQVAYAQRVQVKLETSRGLLDVLKELEFISDDQVKQAIRENHLSMRIGSLLVELGYLSAQALENAFQIQKEDQQRRKLGEILVAHNFISQKHFLEVLSIQLGYPLIDPEFVQIDPHLFTRVPERWYDLHPVLPIRREDNEILVAFADPLDKDAINAARQAFNEDIKPAIAPPEAIRAAIDQARRGFAAGYQAVQKEDSVVGIVDAIITAAVEADASDIHIEPQKDRLRVRFRQDGLLVKHKDLAPELIPSLTSRLKVMCEVNITEKRRHQGGRMRFERSGIKLDLRASFYVTIHGEKIVLRLLNRKNELIALEDVGMAPKMLSRFIAEALDQPSGVVLITGPTGSGKTTTVYSGINRINDPRISIATAEEPVEYMIDGIAQCSINPKINLTFEETLRHIVRQDPDVIVIGEIRDNFSAEIAVQAALTGHKVLTTFHTEDSIGGLIRLLNMDIEAFLVSSTVVSVLAQRLLRKVCRSCATPEAPNPGDLQRMGYSPASVAGARFMKGPGCAECGYTGYRGRVGIFELLVLDEMVRNAILEQRTSFEIRKICIESSGLVTLLEDGIVKAADGVTTLEEVLRCLPRLQPPRPLSELRRALGA